MRLTKDVELNVESFSIQSLKPSDRINQGHYVNLVEGGFSSEKKSFKVGTYYVLSGQKLGSLAAYLLEPETV